MKIEPTTEDWIELDDSMSEDLDKALEDLIKEIGEIDAKDAADEAYDYAMDIIA